MRLPSRGRLATMHAKGTSSRSFCMMKFNSVSKAPEVMLSTPCATTLAWASSRRAFLAALGLEAARAYATMVAAQ